MQPVALIQIALLPTGQIQCKAEGQLSVLTIRGLLGEAQDTLLAQMREQQQKQGLIDVAPPQLSAILGHNGKG